MQNQVIADIDIEGQKIEHYSSVIISQKFNEHHTFSIRVKYDVLEKADSFSLSNAQKLIGKSAVIKLLDANTQDVAYEFHGLVCEINVEQSDNFTNDLVLKGYSPTILMENGPNLNSFYNKKLNDIVDSLTQSLSQVSCSVSNNPQYKSQITYICQYRESGFHFLNRLSAHFGEWFYYDGQQLFFGKPSNSQNVEVTYGVDIHSLQMKLRILPLTFSGYSYSSKDDKYITSGAPSNVDGLDDYGSYVLKQSNNIFSDAVNFPVKQRIESKSDLDGFLKQQKTSMAANLEVLSATSDNPTVCIGAIADVKVSVLTEGGFNKQDGGKFLVTSIDHYITANGKYYNNFEGIPSGITTIPVNNVVVPLAEPQVATVTDNNDPDNLGRVRVQMLWQQSIDEKTDWLRVMTPDAGGGKSNAKNRGFVFIPEVGDQVLVCFRYNDPDRPFVLGSLFQGKTAGGGGNSNQSKSITALSGSIISFDGDAISIIDATGTNKILFDGNGKIDLIATEVLTLTCGKASIELKKDGTITLMATEKDIILKAKDNVKSTAETGDISFDATAANVVANAGAGVKLTGNSEFTASAPTAKATVTGLALSLSATTTAELKGIMVNIN